MEKPSSNLNFNDAIQYLMAGHHIRRPHWIVNSYLYLDRLYVADTLMLIAAKKESGQIKIYSFPLDDVLAVNWEIRN
jgi:hypothetical protein